MHAPPSHPGFAADPREAVAFLEAHPHIAFVELFFTGMSGVPRGKRLRRDELLHVYQHGRFLPGSVLVVDILGSDCEDTGLVWEDGDADRLAMPVPGTLVPAPWLGPDVAQVMTSLHELDGTLNDLDPRAALARVVERVAAEGLTPVVACELEFYLVEPWRGGTAELRRSPFNGREPTGTQAYGLPELEDAAPLLRDLWEAADAQGIPLEGAISEAAPGQLELTLHHKPDALRAADDAVMYKRAVKGTARKHHCDATFMAKPWADRSGSGLHLHASVEGGDGANVFASEDPAGEAPLRHAVGGMAALMAESMAVLAPNMNSYRRFRANSYAPVAPTWGVNNRTVALRVPAGAPPTRHIEHRVAGADANPYLALAVMLAGVHHGLTREIDPGPPIVGDGYAAAAASGAALPTNWFDAVRLFEQSAVLRDYLGERFVEMYATVKKTEQNRFFEVVGDLDYEWYLNNA
jgi:glutamine synthetase